jgi:hypothetical protein
LIFGQAAPSAAKAGNSGKDAIGKPNETTAQCLAAAAALRARCPVTDGGSAVVIAPIGKLESEAAFQALSRALEQLGAGPILTLRFSLQSPGAPAADEWPAAYSLAETNGDLIVRPLDNGTGTAAGSALARVDAAISPALISSEKYGDLIRSLKNRFRFILIEGDPLGVAAETFLLAHKSDGVVFIVREGETAVQELAAAKNMAARARLNVLGFFFEPRPRRGKRT